MPQRSARRDSPGRDQGRRRGQPSCVVVDDHPAVLDALGRLLAGAGLRVAALASRVDEALEAVETERPDLLVCDIRLGEESGIDLVREIVRLDAATAALVYTAYPDWALAQEALDAGARGFALKDAPLAELLRAIDIVREGGIYIDGSLARRLLAEGASERPPLTQREREVLRLLADGLRTEEIGRRLFLSPATVKVHVVKALHKLGARTRSHAVATALRTGIIS